MATINPLKTGNWSDSTVWPGGVFPGAGDDVIAPTSVFTLVTIDQDISVRSLGRGGTNSGGFIVSSIPAGGRTVTTTVGLTGAGSGSMGTVLSVTATGGGKLTVNVPLVSTTNNSLAIVVSGACTVDINGHISAAQIALTISAGAIVTINGDVDTISGHAVSVTGPCTLTVNGNVSGSSGSSGFYGISSNAASTIIVNGDVTGGVGTLSNGIVCSNAAAIISISGTATATSASHAVYALLTAPVRVRHTVDANNGRCAVVSLARVAFAGIQCDATIRDDSASPAGAVIVQSNRLSGVPDPANVRLATMFGAGNSVRGTLIVPPFASVQAGIGVDHGVGTAAISQSVVDASIAAARDAVIAETDAKATGLTAYIDQLNTALSRVFAGIIQGAVNR